jgi:hypothetical protein
MDADKLLSRMTIQEPCSMDWAAMPGDERARHCASCDKHIFDLTAMSPDQAATVLHEQDGQICARVFERADGTLVISDCQALPPPAPGPWQFRIRTIMGLIAGCAVLFGIARSVAVYAGLKQANKSIPPRGTMVLGALRRIDVKDYSAINQGCDESSSEY